MSEKSTKEERYDLQRRWSGGTWGTTGYNIFVKRRGIRLLKEIAAKHPSESYRFVKITTIRSVEVIASLKSGEPK